LAYRQQMRLKLPGVIGLTIFVLTLKISNAQQAVAFPCVRIDLERNMSYHR
jgi:hypothetical protein